MTDHCPVCHQKLPIEERSHSFFLLVGDRHKCSLTREIEVQHKYRRTPDKYQFFYVDRPRVGEADVSYEVYQIPTEPETLKGDTIEERVGSAIRWVRNYLKHNVGREYSQCPTEDFINTWAVLIVTPDSLDCRHVRPMVESLTDKESLYNSCEFVVKYLGGK